MQARRVDKDNLGTFAIDNAANLIARRLGFRARDADAFARKGIDERRFSGIGSANECHKTAMKFSHNISGNEENGVMAAQLFACREYALRAQAIRLADTPSHDVVRRKPRKKSTAYASGIAVRAGRIADSLRPKIKKHFDRMSQWDRAV